jgi:phosphoglycerate dehydrogenase-like enzyme
VLTCQTEAAGATYVKDLKDLLAQSDVVSVHIPLSDATRHFISTEEFKQFKKGARLVNTARGPVVDEEALVEALKSGQISGAALDVFEQEPKVHPYLLQADNVLLQPHVGVGPDTLAMQQFLIRSAEQHCRHAGTDDTRDAGQSGKFPRCQGWAASAKRCQQDRCEAAQLEA